ncbi:teichoic acid biosynthesis protein C [Streptomyces sp. NPDC051776]|uniref:phage baseplate protein n=1 Tax=Streptomyces sp. NPDC051776 TaxID=3155414 RepID=UPI00343F6F80
MRRLGDAGDTGDAGTARDDGGVAEKNSGRRPAAPCRRTVLGLAGALTASLTAPRAAAAPRRLPAQDPPGPQAPAAEAPFDLSLPSTRWIAEKPLHHTTVMQSFGFDESRRHIYAVQLISGGVQLPGESRAYTHAERSLAGDLCMNRLSWDGTLLDRMYLKGFGHGTVMAVEDARADSGPVTLWTECDANPVSGYGRAIGRFPYAAGTVLHSTDPAVSLHWALPGTTNNTAALDQDSRRLLLRYAIGGFRRYALFDLDAFTAGRYVRRADFAQPGTELALPFQGMTLHGDYAYQMLGHSHDPDSPPPDRGDTLLYCIDVRTGEVVQQVRSDTVYALNLREPEGLAVLRSEGPRLCMGYASGPVGARKLSVYTLE